MASTRQEAEAIERKLRPVYEAIDNAQHKKVIQMVEKILKKSPNLYCAKALKGLALLRLGRGEEGSKIINDVIEGCPGDSATLQAVFMYCRELGDYKKMVCLYEKAVHNYPTNEEFLTQLFMAYVRTGDCQKQQKVAVQLTKQFPQNGPYFCWRIMSIVMQGHEADEDTARKMFLPLAERLMEKYVDEKRVESEAEVRLYIALLQSLNKHQKILTLLREDVGQKLRHSDEVLSYELTSLKYLEQWNEIVTKLTSILPQQPDQWSHILLYITAQLKREKIYRETLKNKEEIEKEEGETVSVSPLEEMLTLINNLVSVERTKSSKRTRGPFLAQLEVWKQTSNNDIDDATAPILTSQLSSLPILIEEYFMLFSSKHCCYDDLHGYLYLITKEERDKLFEKLQKYCDDDSVNFTCEDEEIPQNITKLYRDITLLKLHHYSGAHSNFALTQKRQLVMKCYKTFEAGLHFGLSLSATVSQYSDFYVLLGSHLMIEIYQETGDSSDLWQCIIMLESAHRQSPSNHHILLLLVKLYGWLGAIEQCTSLYNKLAIKHIQIDTLGYIVHRYVQSKGAFGFANQMFRLSLRFYVSCNKETSDYVTSSYKNGVFHKIIEIIKLRDKVNRSFNFYTLGVDSMMQEYLRNVTSMEQARMFLQGEKYMESLPFTIEDIDVLCDGLNDNRDLSVYEDWSPPNCQLSKQERVYSFQLECLWIKIRLTIMESLKEMVGVETTPITLEIQLNKLKQLIILLQLAEEHEGATHLRKKSCLLLPIQAPPPPLIHTFLSYGFGSLLIHSIKILMSVLSSPSLPPSSVENDISSARKIIKSLTEQVKGLERGSEGDTSTDVHKSILNTRINLEEYVLMIFISGLVTTLCGVCLERLTGGIKKVGKKKKKATNLTPDDNSSVSQNATVSLILDFLEDIKASLLTMVTRFKTIPEESTLIKRLEDVYLKDSSTENELGMNKEGYSRMRAKVTSEVIESYNICFSDCKEMIELRVSFITNLLQSYRREGSVAQSIVGGAMGGIS